MTATRQASSNRYLSALLLIATCAMASSSAPTYTLILGNRVNLGPIDGIPDNLAFTSVSGTISDMNGDGAPDIEAVIELGH